MIIVLFHVLYLVGKFVYQKYRVDKRRAADDVAEGSGTLKPFTISANDYKRIDVEAMWDDEEEKPQITFSPPAYIQRYAAVESVLVDPTYKGKLRKVVDFGCSKLGFLMHLKNIEGVEEILFVDTDRAMLEEYAEKARPLSYEYLNYRNNPLLIEVYEGSVTDRDKLLENTDAVVCIEIIEHLYPNTLTEFPINIFGYIKPKVAIVTTPNADFNVLFPNLNGFRHFDHKFEWTRKQFQDWAKNIVLRYPDYTVSFRAVCMGPSGTEHLGGCTQMAIFHRYKEQSPVYLMGVENVFKLVASYNYPYRVDNRSDEEKFVQQVMNNIYELNFVRQNGRNEVLLERILDYLSNFSITLPALRRNLEETGWEVIDTDAGPAVIVASSISHSDISLGETWMNEDTHDIDSIDNDSIDDEDAWDADPAPSISAYEYVPPIENDESWDDEPSVIIPENRSMTHENTYLFDGEQAIENIENIHSLNPLELRAGIRSSFRPDAESFNPDTPCRSTQLVSDDLGYSQNFSATASAMIEPTVFRNFCGQSQSNPEDSLSTSDADNRSSAQRNFSVKLKNTSEACRVLDFRSHMSVSRASTSPPPLTESLCLNAFTYDDIAESDESCNQSMLNNTFRHCNLFDMSLGENDVDLILAVSEKFEDHVESFDVNAPPELMETKDSDAFGSITESAKAESECQSSGNGILLTHQRADCVPLMSINNCMSDNVPRYTSSPRVVGKRDAGRGVQSVRGRTELCKNSENSQLIGTSQSSLQSYDNASTASADSCRMFAGRYPAEKKSTYEIDSIESKAGSDKADRSNVNNASLSIDELNESTLRTGQSTDVLDELVTVQKKRMNEKHTVVNDPQACTDTDENKHALLIKKISHTRSPAAVPHAKGSNKQEFESKSLDTDVEMPGRAKSLVRSSAKETSDVESSTFSKCTKALNLRNDTSVSEKTQENEYAFRTVGSECCSTKRPSVTEAEGAKAKLPSPENLETSSNSWSPEIVDSGYPNSASSQDMTPEYDLSSIAHDRISDAESPIAEEAPRLEFLEMVEVENGDLVNNNRDYEGNNIVPAAEVNDLEDLQPLIDDLENDIENENDIYALENEFPIWLLRILEIENPGDLQGQVRQDHERLRQPDVAAGGDAEFARIDEGFDSSTSVDESDTGDDYEMQNDFNNDDDDDDTNDDGDVGDDKDEHEISYDIDNMSDNDIDDADHSVDGSSDNSENDSWTAGDT